MVKFSKQFEGQLVPEWKEAFVDYWQLKKDLKKIHLLNNTNNNKPTKQQTQSSLSNTIFTSLKFSLFGHRHKDHEVIQVHRKLASSASRGDLYETELLEQLDETDAASEFFACLDLQLNKVNQFYRIKEKEFMERGESLKKQMEILIKLKTVLKQQRGKDVSPLDSKEDPSISCTFSRDEESIKDRTEQEQGGQESNSDESEKNDVQFSDSPKSDEMGKQMTINREDGKMRTLSGRMSSCQGKNLRINIPLTNPTCTFSAITYLIWDDLVNQSSRKCGPEGSKIHINKSKLHHAEKMIRGAFIELYKGLGYLKTYRNLNMLAFVKILKKFDKVTGKQVLPLYLKVVESTYFNSSDKVMKLADEVEELFVRHFAEEDKRKAMKYLKPNQRKESHAVTFFIGLFTGCFLALFAGYVIMAHIMGMYKRQSNTVYMETVYPVLRQDTSTQVRAIPGLLLLVFLILFVCPFNILYKSSRYRFLGVIRNIVLSPLYKVVMLDFFVADQLCSQVPMLRNLEYVACYYITGSYKTQDYGLCMRTKYYRDLAYAVSFLPYYWRAMQCARRWFDEGQTSHLINLGKYVSAMFAAGAKVGYERKRSVGYLCLVVIMYSSATVYQLYWDFVKDWGLLQFNSRNPWLRNDLMLRRKIIYYFSMGLNLILRLAWLQTVLHSSFGSVDYRVTGLFLAALEVIRRGLWNFFRLENEHLNNAGKFRAVKTVPLPFHEVDDDD
ncbi:EXS, C-terminal [Dillenia turbinata]|uniref:EXS, C-terminal n=1 Tax=Dillenia turbinata TaxID=194707 RepID=A0AAN8VK77_9MAGN